MKQSFEEEAIDEEGTQTPLKSPNKKSIQEKSIQKVQIGSLFKKEEDQIEQDTFDKKSGSEKSTPKPVV